MSINDKTPEEWGALQASKDRKSRMIQGLLDKIEHFFKEYQYGRKSSYIDAILGDPYAELNLLDSLERFLEENNYSTAKFLEDAKLETQDKIFRLRGEYNKRTLHPEMLKELDQRKTQTTEFLASADEIREKVEQIRRDNPNLGAISIKAKINSEIAKLMEDKRYAKLRRGMNAEVWVVSRAGQCLLSRVIEI